MTDPTVVTFEETSAATPVEEVRSILQNRVSWGAILAGVVVALSPKYCSPCSELA